jgi:hypothetical protein
MQESKQSINFKKDKISYINSKLTIKDILGNIGVRMNMSRMNYKVNPGLFGIGNPDSNSPVLVTSNYKYSFDSLRKELDGINAWVLVLDTNGVNVWCAAGKGTFGTAELINRIEKTNLKQIVNHREIILPQLGAPGITAHEIKNKTGFKVIYGPVYAKDIKYFLKNDLTKTEEMHQVNFNLIERIKVIPIELIQAWGIYLALLLITFILNTISNGKISITFLIDFIPILFSILTGTILFPILLPFLPFRAFTLKGTLLGIILSLVLSIFSGFNITVFIINLLFLTPIVSFLSFGFTGASTFTSLSGVKLEATIAFPIFIISIISGLVLKIFSIIHII